MLKGHSPLPHLLSALLLLGVALPPSPQGGPIIVGSPDFVTFQRAALDRLQEDLPIGYFLVSTFVDQIREQPYEAGGTGFDPLGYDSGLRTIWTRVTLWNRLHPEEAAAQLVHEAGHAYLWTTCQQWYGPSAEWLANGWQAGALERLGGNPWQVAWLRDWQNNHALKPGYPVLEAQVRTGCP